MDKTKFLLFFLLTVFCLGSSFANPDTDFMAYELLYIEQETGTDQYKIQFTVTSRYLRIDDLSDRESGYIIYDNKESTIYSVSHLDKSILVMPYIKHHQTKENARVEVIYRDLPGAPAISGKKVMSFVAKTENEKCVDVQIAVDLLPEVTQVLKAYRAVLSSQQVKIVNVTPEEYRTDCFYYDQVYNNGDYYDKGLPIQEWHSSGKRRALETFRELKVNANLFAIPDGYRKYSLD